MGSLTGKLLRDDDLKEMYCPDNGRPSLAPSMMAGALMLQFYDDVSDGEAVERILYDLRWKVALNLPLDYGGFDASSMSVFRARLVKYQQERYAFDRLLAVAREEGFLADKSDLVERHHQCKRSRGTQDTYTCYARASANCSKPWAITCPGKTTGLLGGDREIISNLCGPGSQSRDRWSDSGPAQRTTHYPGGR